MGVSIQLCRGSQILKVQRGRPPGVGEWHFPGGALRLGETVEDGARRELREETGLEAGPLRLAAAVDRVERDDAGRIRHHYVVLSFAADWIGGEPIAGGDAQAAAWFDAP